MFISGLLGESYLALLKMAIGSKNFTRISYTPVKYKIVNNTINNDFKKLYIYL